MRGMWVRRVSPTGRARGLWRRAALALLGAALTLALAACSVAGSGLGSVPLTGLGAEAAPTAPPTLSGAGPGGQFAFVYGDQVWLKTSDAPQPKQLTHLVVQNGAYVAWGPLVWSPDGHFIAFVMVQDPSGGHPARTNGPLYVVGTDGTLVTTPGTASVVGHGYAWYGTNALFYANPSGISFADLSVPGDAEAHSVAPGQSGPTFNGGATFYSYTDLGFSGRGLIATQLAITSPGAVGQVGQAVLVRFDLPVSASDYAGGSMGIGRGGLYGYDVGDLGQAYADATGTWRGGSWQVGPNGDVVLQRVTGLDTKAGTVSSTICYNYYLGNYCNQQLLQQVSKTSMAAPAQFAFSPDGGAVAMTGATLALQQRDGGNFSSSAPASVGMPVWSSDGKTIAATQLVSASPDSAGVIHYVTNVLTYAVGGKGAVAIAGAQNLSWSPS